MVIINRQHSKLPPPIVVSEENSFAYFTFCNRLPVIVTQVIEENNFNDTVLVNLETLKEDIKGGTIRNLLDTDAPDIEDWKYYIKPFLGKTWVDTPFYFAEAYFYRRLLEAIEYFSGDTESSIDPFSLQKRLGLESVIESIRNVCTTLIKEKKAGEDQQHIKALFRNLMYLNLWGNKADLSLNPSKAGNSDQFELNIDNQSSQILIDDTSTILEKSNQFQSKRVDLIADNSGFELFTDFCIADFLLSCNLVETVYIHLKKYPTFVSDATIEDSLFTIKYFANDQCLQVSQLGTRLQEFIKTNRLCLADNFFWNAPLEFLEMPESLFKDLQESDLILIKGDANYRRLIGDRHWDFTHSFESIVSYFPTNLVAIRTLKSEVIVGLTNEQIDQLNKKDSKWLVNGKRGVIQTYYKK